MSPWSLLVAYSSTSFLHETFCIASGTAVGCRCFLSTILCVSCREQDGGVSHWSLVCKLQSVHTPSRTKYVLILGCPTCQNGTVVLMDERTPVFYISDAKRLQFFFSTCASFERSSKVAFNHWVYFPVWLPGTFSLRGGGFDNVKTAAQHEALLKGNFVGLPSEWIPLIASQVAGTTPSSAGDNMLASEASHSSFASPYCTPVFSAPRSGGVGRFRVLLAYLFNDVDLSSDAFGCLESRSDGGKGNIKASDNLKYR